MNVPLIVLLLAVIAFSIITNRHIVEGLNYGKAYREMSGKERKREKNKYGVHNKYWWMKARWEQSKFMENIKKHIKKMKKADDKFKSQVAATYQKWYKRKDLVFNYKGEIYDEAIDEGAKFGQVDENQWLGAFKYCGDPGSCTGVDRNGAEDSTEMLNDDGEDINRWQGGPWYSVIYNTILGQAKRVHKRDGRGVFRQTSDLFKKLGNDGGGGMTAKEMQTELSDYTKTKDLESDYTKTKDLESDYTKTKDLEDHMLNGNGDTDYQDLFFKTFALTQNESGMDDWIDKDAIERKEIINDRYNNHIRFFSS